jgi:lysophospholipase L1-like esterase
MSKSIFWAGDSTVKENDFTTYPQTGIGQGMHLFTKKEVLINNYAENGRSTKNFIDESRLAVIYDEIRKDDFLFIQFGHNDGKIEDPNRYCEAFGEYQENLEKFVNVARNRKAHPVLITPLCRRWFQGNNQLQEDIHGDYPKAMIDTAQRLDVPYIDLFSASVDCLKSLGIDGSKKLFMNLIASDYVNYPEGLDDNTHLRYEGAVLFANIIALELKNLGGIYGELLLTPDKLLNLRRI